MTNTVSERIAAALVRHEVEIIFGQSNPTSLMLAAEDRGIRQILFRTENAGGVMADGYARMSNRVGVLAVQNGPAATLAVAPMAEALKASIPMIVLVQDVPTTQRDKNAFQDFDHTGLFNSVSKWTRSVDDVSRIDDYIDHAFVVANSGRPGPVVLLLPRNILDQEATAVDVPRSAKLGRFPLDRPRPDHVLVEQAANLIAKAKRPVIIAGGGVHGSQAVQALGDFIETSHVPVATTNMGKGTVDENGPLSLGVAANITGFGGPAYHMRDLICDADVVLFVGTRTNENGTDSWTLTGTKATYIHIDIDPIEIGRNYEALRLLGDCRAALEDLTEAMSYCNMAKREAARAGIESRIAEGRAKREIEIKARRNKHSDLITPQLLMAELDDLLLPEDIVAADASMGTLWVTGFLTARKAGQRFITPRGLAGLGWGMPYAMGAKLATPDARVFTIVGDGGFAHVWSETETAVREEIPVVTIVLNNGELSYQKHGERFIFGRTTSGIAFSPVDHAAVAESVGALGLTINSAKEIRPTLQKAIESDRPVVIDAHVDPDSLPPLPALNETLEAAQ